MGLLSADEKLKYIVPLVIFDASEINQMMADLTTQLQADATTSLNNAMTVIQPRIENMLGSPLTPDQVTEVRGMIAGQLNPAIQRMRVS